MKYICTHGKLIPVEHPVIMADNRGYRYGDGLFETMKMVNKKIPLWTYHWQRLFDGLTLLKYEVPSTFTAGIILQEIIILASKNQCDTLGQVRLSVSRGSGNLYSGSDGFQYVIECYPTHPSANEWNINGLTIDLYTASHKSCDSFSHIKSANFLPYVMAAAHAREHKFHDCLVLNQFGRIADATIANVFIIKNDQVLTPPLSEGCIGGVMRKWIFEKMKDPFNGLQLSEEKLSTDSLLAADEVFLTNSVQGIRWVKQFKDKTYDHTRTSEIYNQLVKTIWE